MEINGKKSVYENAAFLGGTCGTSTWRSELIPLLDEKVMYFNPQLAPGEWNDAAAKAEDDCKKVCKVLVFILTADSISAYSGFEIGVLTSKNPERMIFCALGEFQEDQQKGINKIARDVREMGGTVCKSLGEIAKLVNSQY